MRHARRRGEEAMTDLDVLRLALEIGQDRSSDPRTRVGAVLVCRGQMIGYGANRTPPGVRYRQSQKYDVTEHAERDAIYAAALAGHQTAGASLYAPWFACCDCARGIILAGIREVVGLASLRAATPARWAENIALAETMLDEAGVGMRWLAGEAGVTITFDGRDFSC